MQILSSLNSNSDGYSIVNKNYLELVGRDYVKCAVANITGVTAQANYTITHNLGTSNIVLSAYDTSKQPISVDVTYSVPDASTVVLSFDSLGGKNPNVRVVIMGALTHSVATVTNTQTINSTN